MTNGKLTAIAAGVLLASNVSAVPLTNYLVNGAFNNFEDQSREIAIDTDNDGNVSVGDIFLGYLVLDNRVDPVGLPLNSDGTPPAIVVPFSTQLAVAGMDGSLAWGPTDPATGLDRSAA